MKPATVALVALLFASFVLVSQLWAQRETNPPVLSGDNVGVRVVTPPDKDGRVGVLYMVKLGGTWHETYTVPQVVK